MLTLPTYSAAAISRPSLLMQYLRAIGPGVVIVKAGPTGSRNDATGCELLRYYLWQWAFLPQPDAHFPLNINENTQYHYVALNRIKKYKTFGGTNQNPEIIEKYRLWKTTSIPMIMRWKESSETFISKPNDWHDWVLDRTTIPEAGPILIIGSPEGYLSYENPDNNKKTTPLRQILTESGYSDKIRMLLPHDGGGIQLGNEKISIGERKGYQRDISLIFMGRANNGRTVIVLAGASNTFGTFSAIRVAADYGRNEVNSMVLDFIKNPDISNASIAFSTERHIYTGTFKPLRLTDSISIRFSENREQKPIKCDLDFRKAEFELNQLDSTPSIPKTQQTTLAKYLSEQGSIGIITKWYPQDLRDDATAMDILEFTLDDSANYPVPPAIPIYHKGVEDKFEELINAFTSSKRKEDQDESNEKTGSLAQSLMYLDDECYQLFSLWEEANGKLKTADGVFANWFDSQFQTPSDGPVIIMGTPSSFLGSGSQENERKTNLCKMLTRAGYPNRYILQHTGIHGIIQGEIYDRKTFTTKYKSNASDERDSTHEEDAGIISLSKGPDGRDVLIVAGITWLGTLAGVRLLFTQQRPTIDRCVHDYSQGLRRRIDIFYTCKVPKKVSSLGDRTSDTKQTIWPTPLDLDEISIDTHESETEPELIHNRYAEECFQDLFIRIRDRKPGSVEIPLAEKDNFLFDLQTNDTGPLNLNMSCQHSITAGDIKVACGTKIKELYQSIDNCLEEDFPHLSREFKYENHGDVTKYPINKMETAEKPYCGKFFVLGESGVGKENIAKYLRDRIKERKQYDPSLVVLNTACISENLLQDEIFGSVVGAFSDGKGRKSPFEKAKGGVLFLDEFAALDGNSSLFLQASLLRAMESFTVTRLGASESLNINCVLVAATNRATSLKELQYLIESKVIRSDIGNRFEGRLFSFPPLRDRPLEILPAFVSKIRSNYEKAEKACPDVLVTAKALELLLHFNFPGNFRQLDGIAKGLVRLIDSRKEQNVLRISFRHMHQCLFLGDSNVVDEFDPHWVKISVDFPNATTAFPNNRSASLWQGSQNKKHTRPAFEHREFPEMLQNSTSYRFVKKCRDETKDQSFYFKKFFFDLIQPHDQPKDNIDAYVRLISDAKNWYSNLCLLPKRTGAGRPKDYSNMNDFAVCVLILSQAKDIAYNELVSQHRLSELSHDLRFQFACRMLSSFINDDASQKVVCWEIFVTIVFLYTGFDIRTDLEKEWMNWVADQRGLVRPSP
jgi:transcriptional regulator with AAA-type ATPase domain